MKPCLFGSRLASCLVQSWQKSTRTQESTLLIPCQWTCLRSTGEPWEPANGIFSSTAVNPKAKVHGTPGMQQHANMSSTNGGTLRGWQFCPCNFGSIDEGTRKAKDAILFDSQSTDHLFSNRNSVEKARKMNSGTTFNTNGGLTHWDVVLDT